MVTRTRLNPYASSLAVLSASFALGLSSCRSNDDDATAVDAIRETYRQVRTAIIAQDGARACAAMTPRLQRTATENFADGADAGCAEAIEMEIFAPRATGELGRVTEIEVNGDTAVATTMVKGFGQSAMRFTREGDQWKLDR